MKKTIAVLLALALFACCAACGGSEAQASCPEGTQGEYQPNETASGGAYGGADRLALGELNTGEYPGRFYSAQTLYDPASGVGVMDLLLPSGWSANASVNWETVSTVFPGFATVTLQSSDGGAAILIHSAQNYLETYSNDGLIQHQDYTDTETYTTHLRCMDAEAVLQYHFENVYGSGCEVLRKNEVSPELQSQIEAIAARYSAEYQSTWTQLAGQYGVSVSMRDYEGKVADNRYRVTASDGSVYYAEACCYTIAVLYDVNSSASVITQLPWECPEIIILMANTEEELDAHYDEYRTVFTNAAFTDEFYYLNHIYANQIQNAIMQHLTQKTAAMTKAQAQSMLSGYESGSYGSDDWANDWSDYIYDRNEYTTSDGGIVEASTAYDAVYQNGSDFYMGSSGSAPYGWDALSLN